jgi:hypothetical protein
VLAVMGLFHQWWLCNSGGCSGVVCSESGADLHLSSVASPSNYGVGFHFLFDNDNTINVFFTMLTAPTNS